MDAFGAAAPQEPDSTILSDLRVEIVPRISDVDPTEWDELALGTSFYCSHGWLSAVEAERTARSTYLLAWEQGRLVAALPLYRVTYESYPLYSADRYRSLFGFAGSLLLAGAYKGYRSEFITAAHVSEVDKRRVLSVLVQAALECALVEDAGAVVFPYLTSASVDRLCTVASPHVALDSIEASLFVGDTGLEGYLKSLPAKWRTRARREIRAFRSAGWNVAEGDLATDSVQLAGLLAQIQRKYGHHVSSRSLGRILGIQAEHVGRRALLLECREASGSLAAFSLAYVCGDRLYDRMVGFDYPRLRSAYEYFNLAFYSRIERMRDRGLRQLSLGIGSLEAKVTRGAQIRPLWAALLLTRPHVVTETDNRERALQMLEGVPLIPRLLPQEEWAFLQDD